jgi:hypothetical protein
VGRPRKSTTKNVEDFEVEVHSIHVRERLWPHVDR